jgi:hypothetical protein
MAKTRAAGTERHPAGILAGLMRVRRNQRTTLISTTPKIATAVTAAEKKSRT